MALPNKKKGFRKIVIQNQAFNWRLGRLIDVRPDSRKANQLNVDFEWSDDYYYYKEVKDVPNFEPTKITPKFVSEAIEYALENGWNTSEKHGVFHIKYRDKKFEVVVFSYA